ncbi:MAG: hypothetical protein GOMPHAMPRED_005822 [Gomphillus americanus]|uniref:Cytochrome b mRNA-processing protein 4 n=1 Tax=Gomphillus americanus TaxID=1940652 RepID=A0A8H3IK75_9LECA|nr:MAG: hypothetical protein GOMPHAMPRED_005822 [Gomphillus americanus]
MSARTWIKMAVAGVVTCVGGPALVWYVTPDEEELFKRYNPDLQRRSLEGRKQRQEDYEKFVGKLKEYSKSDKPMWEVARLDQAKMREEALALERQQLIAAQARADEIKKLTTSGS